MNIFIKLSVMSVLFLCLPVSASASFWIKCEVAAHVTESSIPGKYNAEIRSARTIEGHSKKGSPCMNDNIGKTIEIFIEGDVKAGKENRLEYEFYNGMGENGVVNNESWSVRKSFLNRIFSK